MTDRWAEKIKAAELPPSVAKSTLPGIGRPDLRVLVAAKDFKQEHGYTNYVFQPERGAAKSGYSAVIAMFAKEILLSGVPVYYVPHARLLQSVRLYGTDQELACWPLSAPPGYWVIPDLATGESMGLPGYVHAEAGDWIGRNIRHGGGVILGTQLPWATVKLPETLLAILGEPKLLSQ